ncbi:MAG: glycosyltransferase [Nitrososphaerota archaeon]|nr:glycosyltransferase [Nitrososphaerota archaeon]
MKVCMISGLAKFSGGLENVVNELSRVLINHNDAVVNIFGRSNHDFVDSEYNRKVIGVGPCFFIPHGIGIPWKFEYSLKTWRKIKAFGSYDIIHGHGDNCLFSSLFRGGG